MNKTTYTWEPFELQKALFGALVGFKVNDKGEIVDGVEDFAYWDVSKCGKVVEDTSNNRISNYKVTIEGTIYWINDRGKVIYSLDDLHVGWDLYVVNAVLAYSEGTSQMRGTTRGGGGDEEETTMVTLSSLEPRDSFAIQILQGMLRESNHPESYDDANILASCGAAYRWAQGMMQASADYRKLAESGSGGGETPASETEAVTVDMTDVTTSEKLLNNIVAALQRTDEIAGTKTVPAYWYKSGEQNVEGPHTDAIAQTLPHGEGEAYTNVAAAEADGWKWKAEGTATGYAEKITLNGVTMSGLEALIKQLRGAHTATSGEGEGATTTEEFYNETLFEHYLREIINDYVKHTPEEGESNTTVGLDDLIKAVNGIAAGQGGSTSIDFTSLNNTLTNSIGSSRSITTLPNVNIGNSGLGRDADHPIFMSGGGFPSRSVLAASLTETVIHDFLTFNAAGAVGYSTKEETKKAILGYLNSYATLSALSTAILGEITATAVYNKIESNIDTRIKAWLNATTIVADGSGWKLNVPNSI